MIKYSFWISTLVRGEAERSECCWSHEAYARYRSNHSYHHKRRPRSSVLYGKWRSGGVHLQSGRRSFEARNEPGRRRMWELHYQRITKRRAAHHPWILETIPNALRQETHRETQLRRQVIARSSVGYSRQSTYLTHSFTCLRDGFASWYFYRSGKNSFSFRHFVFRRCSMQINLLKSRPNSEASLKDIGSTGHLCFLLYSSTHGEWWPVGLERLFKFKKIFFYIFSLRFHFILLDSSDIQPKKIGQTYQHCLSDLILLWE